MTDNPIMETAEVFYNKEAEPKEPTVTTQAQEPEQDPDRLEVETPETPAEPEESGTAEELEAKDDEKESQYIELDGDEIDLEDVKKWRDGHLMQSDYTKKTTALAEDRKAVKSERESLLKDKAQVSELRDTLQVLVTEDEAIDWEELKTLDPDEYIKKKEKADKRKEALEKVKAERETPIDDPATIASEQTKLFESNPGWLEDGKPTELFKADTSLMNDYVIKAGFTVEEFSQLTKAHYLTTILKAAKYDQLQEKGREITSKREKVPVVTRPKATNQKPAEKKSAAEVFYG